MEEGCRSWYQALFEDHYAPLCRYALSLHYPANASYQDVEDIVQDVFHLLWGKRDKLIRHENIAGWLYKATYNKVRTSGSKEYRRAKRHAGTVNEAITADPNSDIDPETLLLLNEQQEKIKEVIGEENYRLLMDYYDVNISSEALARRLGIGVFALRTRVHRIIEKLRKVDLRVFFILYVMLFGFAQLQGGGEHKGAGKGRKSGNRSGNHRFLTLSMVAAIRDHESAKPWQDINLEVLRLCSLVLTHQIRSLSPEEIEKAWTAVISRIRGDEHRLLFRSRRVRVILVTVLLVLLLASICFAAFRPWIVTTLFGVEQVHSVIETTQQVSPEPQTYSDALGADFVECLIQNDVQVILPSWIPDGYSLTMVEAKQITGTTWEVTARYTGEASSFSIQINRYVTEDAVMSYNIERDEKTLKTMEHSCNGEKRGLKKRRRSHTIRVQAGSKP